MSTRANGEGSVWKRKDGRWCAGAYVPVAGGGVRRVYVYGRTRQDANRKLRELLDRTEKHIPVAPASLTVASYLEEWLVHIRQHVRPTTYAGYESNVRLHRDLCRGHAPQDPSAWRRASVARSSSSSDPVRFGQ